MRGLLARSIATSCQLLAPLRGGIALALLFVTATAFAANEIAVDRSTVRRNEIVNVTVTLVGAFARGDQLELPVRNLELIGEPSVSSQYSWINGETKRTKVFRFRARAIAVGPAQAGPVVISGDGQRETLPAIAITVAAERRVTNDPATALRELREAGKDPLFTTVSADRQRAYVGEPVVVTWFLFNGANIQQSRVVRMPAYREFWAEESDVSKLPVEEVNVGDEILQKVPIRRVALIPLRGGRFEIEGVTIEAAVMRRLRGSPLSIFEGTLEEITYTSPSLTIDALPVPPGPPVGATGTLQLQCGAPAAKGAGPIAIDVILSGRGNVRSAVAPRFASPLEGHVDVEEQGVEVKIEPSFSMSRRWRYLIFPNRSGELTIPPLAMTIFDPSTAARRELGCGGGTVHAEAAEGAEGRAAAAPSKPVSRSFEAYVPAVAAIALLIAGVGVALPRIVRTIRMRRDVRRLLRGTPSEVRARVDERIGIAPGVLLREPGERGDAYRAVRSLIDAADRDHSVERVWRREAARRVTDLLDSLGSSLL